MNDAIDSAQSNPAIRCLILTGRSGIFTAGNDIGDFPQAATSDDDMARPRNAVIFLQSLVNNKKPIIAAVDGIAIGIGTTMVFHCDYVIASTTTTLSSPSRRGGRIVGSRLSPSPPDRLSAGRPYPASRGRRYFALTYIARASWRRTGRCLCR